LNLHNYIQTQHPPLGAHTSIGGGLYNALYSGKTLGCEVVQIFSKNQMQWKSKALTLDEIDKFLTVKNETGVIPVTVHGAYLINLGSFNSATHRKSFDAFVEELQRCELLEIPFLVIHPGAHMGAGEERGLKKIAESVQNAYEKAHIQHTTILLETTAGQGTNLGYKFEQINFIIEQTGLNNNIGVCLDTCHVFAAGYDIRTKEIWTDTKKNFNQIVGLNKLKTIHLNDSKKDLGSRVDRHERIGNGKIGLNAFRILLNDHDLQKIPMILEIPGGNEAYENDLKLLRSLFRKI
jgi:deoxyribonuclease-4